jgi:hypothetical protein
MSHRRIALLLLVVFLNGCAVWQARVKEGDERIRGQTLQDFIRRLGSPDFHPVGGEQMYPFTFVFQKAEGGEMVRQGEGFVLAKGSLWCLVQHWQDSHTDSPGQRMFIVDRSTRKLEAEVRHWPEGNPRQRWNNWICIRDSAVQGDDSDLYHCEYYYPEGTERFIRKPQEWGFYQDFFWNEDGLLEKTTRFSNSSSRYRYEGVKLKRIDYGIKGTVRTFVEFTYK